MQYSSNVDVTVDFCGIKSYETVIADDTLFREIVEAFSVYTSLLDVKVTLVRKIGGE